MRGFLQKQKIVLIVIIVFSWVMGFLFYRTYPTQEEWLKKQASYLSRLTITEEMKEKAYSWKQHSDGMWHLSAEKGVIPVGRDGVVFVITHSLHQNTFPDVFGLCSFISNLTGRKRVADATMAVDEQGRLYTCEGHICGRLSLTSDKEIENLQDFLNSYSYNDPKNKWKRYQP